MDFGHRDEPASTASCGWPSASTGTMHSQVGVEVRQDGDHLDVLDRRAARRSAGRPGRVLAQVARVVSADHDGEHYARVCQADPVLKSGLVPRARVPAGAVLLPVRGGDLVHPECPPGPSAGDSGPRTAGRGVRVGVRARRPDGARRADPEPTPGGVGAARAAHRSGAAPACDRGGGPARRAVRRAVDRNVPGGGARGGATTPGHRTLLQRPDRGPRLWTGRRAARRTARTGGRRPVYGRGRSTDAEFAELAQRAGGRSGPGWR